MNGSAVADGASAASLSTRLFPLSATYRLPALSSATPAGFFRPVIGNSTIPEALNLSTRLFPPSATYTVPAPSTATPVGFLRPVKGNWIGDDEPAACLSTRLFNPPP